ncbi:MAG: tetratricopeptide repeat protein [Deltaproteobacteria bacterium]|nr:tetratricopeptide repeat protein [Deltaproteobacteria bacterium]
MSKSSARSELQVDVKDAPTAAMDLQMRRSSEAMHAFLLGQLAYDAEDSQAALKNFIIASEFNDDPAPFLNTKLAELYIADGQLEKALGEADKAIQAEPENAEHLLLRAGILDALGRSDETLSLYLKATQLDPRRFDTAILLSNYYLTKDQSARALEVLEAFVKVAPQDAIGWYFLGRAYDRQSQYVKSLAAFREAEKLDAQNNMFAFESLRTLLKLKRYREAHDCADEIARKDPQNLQLRQLAQELGQGDSGAKQALSQLQFLTEPLGTQMDARFRIASIEIERRLFRDSVTQLRLVLAANPTNAQARYYLASLFAGAGRKKEALQELSKITKDQELYVKSRTFAAFIMRQDGDLKRAEVAVREALAFDPENKNILSYLILILRDAKKYKEAEELMRKSVEEDPQNDRLLFNYAILLGDMGREADSQKVIETVIQLNPKNSDALNYLAYGLSEQDQNLPRALELIDRALQVRPDDGYYLDTLGWIYFKMGKFDQAEATLRRAAATVTEDIVVQEHFGDSLVKIEKFDEAVEVYRNALERGRDQNDKDEAEAVARIEKKLSALIEAFPHLSYAATR